MVGVFIGLILSALLIWWIISGLAVPYIGAIVYYSIWICIIGLPLLLAGLAIYGIDRITKK